MAKSDGRTVFDLRPAHEASAALLGYFVYNWFGKYLEIVAGSLRRLSEAGAIKDIGTPTEHGRHILFDFGALNLERLSYIVGIYFYVLSSHKWANRLLMNRQDVRQVLYLRGYEYEASMAAGGGIALGMSTMHTQQFGWKLRELLSGRFPVFKVMSPKDVFWETVDAQNCFYGDFDGMIGLIRQRPVSVYLNALDWKVGVADLLDRMDHYVVYVSSITESAMWEIEQLDTPERRERATIVFDEKAIRNKEFQLDLQDRIQDDHGDKLIWRKTGPAPAATVEELREKLAGTFLLVTPEEFETQIDRHMERIENSAGKLAAGAREKWIDFAWHPALPADRLAELRATSDSVQKRIERAMRDGIAALPLFLIDIHLRIYMTLLLGEHWHAGRALASMRGLMQACLDYYEPPGERMGALSPENRESHLEMLRQHRDYAEYAAVRLLGYGRSHEFEDRSEAAIAETESIFQRTKTAVDRFFTERGGPGPGSTV